MNNTKPSAIIGIMHLSGLVFAGFGAAFMFLVSSPGWAKDEARHALNWQLTVLILNVVGAITMQLGIGAVIIALVYAANVIFSLIAAYKSFNGITYAYPYAIPIINRSIR